MRIIFILLLLISTIAYAQSRSSGSSGTNSSGTVTTIISGVGLVPATITSSGTLNVDVGTTANKIVQLTSGAQYPAVDGNLITNLNAANKALSNLITTNINQDLIFNTGSAATIQTATADSVATKNLSILTGITTTSGSTGRLILESGISADLGNTGDVTVSSGISSLGNSGGLDLLTGAAPAGNSGSISLATGSAGGTMGDISMSANSIKVNGTPLVGLDLPVLGDEAANKNYVDAAVSGAAGVTRVVGGAGIVPNTITTTGTLVIDTGTTANKIVKLTSGAQYPAVDGNLITNVNAVKLQTFGVATTTPSGTVYLGWNSTTNLWEPRTLVQGNAFVSGGNAFAGNTNIGLTDNFNLNVITSNSTRMTVDWRGFVGIGTTTPLSMLQVSQDINGTGLNYDIGQIVASGAATPTAGVTVGYDTTNNKGFIYARTTGVSSRPLDINKSSIYSAGATGVVGMGTATPQSVLDVVSTSTMSAIIVPRATTAARNAAPVNGMFRYNTDNAKFEVYENSAWANMRDATQLQATNINTVAPSNDQFLAYNSTALYWNATSNLRAGAGTAALPSISFSGDPDTGFYNGAGNNVVLATNGTARITFTTAIISQTSNAFSISTGTSAATTTYGFLNDEDTGMFRSTTNTVGFAGNGLQDFQMNVAASSVNWPSTTSSATTAAVIYGAAGSDTNIGINVTPKGAGIVTVANHLVTSGTAPSITANCGTSPSVAGNDTSGRITVGTGGTDVACTLTFAATWTTAPSCQCNDESTALLFKCAATTSTLVITAAAPLGAADKITYHCIGY